LLARVEFFNIGSREFFDAEKEYVNDIRQMIEKKLVSQKAVASLGECSHQVVYLGT
jgi:hypothetical protein